MQIQIYLKSQGILVFLIEQITSGFYINYIIYTFSKIHGYSFRCDTLYKLF